MSGEVLVLAGALSGPAGWAVMGAIGAFRAGQLASEWLRHERALAERKMQKEKQAAEAWQRHHRARQEAIRRATEQREAVRRRLAGLRLQAPPSTETDDRDTSARGFVDVDRQGLMAALERVIAGASESGIDDSPGGPLRRLAQQALDLDAESRSGSPPPAEVIAGFQAAVARTVEALLAEKDVRDQSRRSLLDRLEALLGEAIAYRHLARDGEARVQLSQLKDQLVGRLIAGTATPAAIDLLEERLGRIKAAIDTSLEQAATGEALRECTRSRLEGLGYRPISEEGEHSEWEIPGGERLRMALQPGQRIAFQLVHEREARSSQPLSVEELEKLRRQEQRWCEDFHALLRGLHEDGIELQVQLERETPQTAIPIVVLEDVEEWLEEEADRDASAKRRFP